MNKKRKYLIPLFSLFVGAALTSCAVGEAGPQGEKGEAGERGQQGLPGEDGATPEIVNGYWWIDGQNTGIPATGEPGEDGATPEIIEGYWWIDGQNTGIPATGSQGSQGPEGPQGPSGNDGADGATPEIVNGYWWIDGENTGVPVTGAPGEDGASMLSGQGEPASTLGKNGDLYLDLSCGDLYVKAEGEWSLEANIIGLDGEEGEDGKSAYELYKEEHPEYTGDEQQWLKDLVNGDLAEKDSYNVLFYVSYMDKTNGLNADLVSSDKPTYAVPADAKESMGGFSMEVKKGEFIPRPADPVLEGFDFEGWKVCYKDVANKYHYEDFLFRSGVCMEQTTLYASYVAKQYTMTIHFGDDETIKVPVQYRHEIELPYDVTKKTASGEVFAGLYQTADFTQPFDYNAAYSLTSDVELWAKHDAPSLTAGTYYLDKGDSYQMRLEVSNTQIVAKNFGSSSFAKEEMTFKLKGADIDGNFVFAATSSTENDRLIVKGSGSNISVVAIYKWSSNENYCRVSNVFGSDFYGLTAENRAKAFITLDEYVANTTFTVKLNGSAETEIEVFKGDKISYEFLFDDGASIKLATLEFSSEYLSHNSYSKEFTAVKAGETLIKFADSDGRFVTKLVTIVEKQFITSATVKKDGVEVSEVSVEKGAEFDLTIETAGEHNIEPVWSWTSNKESVATVDATGHVVAVGKGDAKITVSDTAGSGISKVVNITVTESIEIPTDLQGTFTITVEDYDCNEIEIEIVVNADGTATWSYTDPYSDEYAFDLEVMSGEDGVFKFQSDEASFTLTLSDDGEIKLSEIEDVNLEYVLYVEFAEEYVLKEGVAAELTSITVKTAPKTSYVEGEKFDPTGLVITAHYSDASSQDVTYGALTKTEFTFNPGLETALATSNTSVAITWGEKTVNQTIEVTAKQGGQELECIVPEELQGNYIDVDGSIYGITITQDSISISDYYNALCSCFSSDDGAILTLVSVEENDGAVVYTFEGKVDGDDHTLVLTQDGDTLTLTGECGWSGELPTFELVPSEE